MVADAGDSLSQWKHPNKPRAWRRKVENSSRELKAPGDHWNHWNHWNLARLTAKKTVYQETSSLTSAIIIIIIIIEIFASFFFTINGGSHPGSRDLTGRDGIFNR